MVVDELDERAEMPVEGRLAAADHDDRSGPELGRLRDGVPEHADVQLAGQIPAALGVAVPAAEIARAVRLDADRQQPVFIPSPVRLLRIIGVPAQDRRPVVRLD